MIRIARESGWADRLRAYQVILDGEVLGELKNGEEKEFEVATGRHILSMKIDWCKSPPVAFEQAAEAVEFQCGSNLRGLKLLLIPLYATVFSGQYLWLRRTDRLD